MTSEDNAKTPDQLIQDIIGGHASDIEAIKKVSDIDNLSERIERLEFAIEEVGQASEFLDSYSKYCTAQTEDLHSIRNIRVCAIVFAYLVMILLLGTFICIVFYPTVWFEMADGAVQAAFVVGTLAGALSLLAVILKGAFRSISEKSKDDMVPEHIKFLKDASNSVINNISK